MNIFAISGLINAIGIFTLGAVVYFKNRKREINIRYTLFCFFVAFWSFCYFLWQIAQDRDPALFWVRGLMVGAIFIPVCFLHFVLLLLDIYKTKKKIVNIGYLIFFFFLVADFTPWFVSDVKPKLFFRFWPEPGPLFGFFLLIWLWYCMYPCYLLIRDYKKFTGIKRQQIKYVLIGILIGYSSGSTNYFLWYDIPIPPYGNFIVPLFVGMMAYAVIRLRLMDITILVTRTLIFSIVYLFVLGIPLGLTGWGKCWLQGLFGQNWYWAPVILAIILASSGPFIFLFLQRRTEKILRKEQLTYQEKLRVTSSTMMLTKDLDKLLRAIVLNVVDIVRVAWAAIYLKDEKESKYIRKYQRAREGEIDLPKEFAFDSELVKRFHQNKLPLIGEEIYPVELKVGLAVPCFLDSNMIGFLLLGDKPKGRMYDQSDVNEFTLLSNQTALAIENCQFYVRERQAEHSRKISSLDIQSASMAHEIDNPNQAILRCMEGVEIILEELEGVIPKDKMEQLKYKLSRGKYNSTRISKMLEAVREYCQVSTGEHKATSLKDLIESYHEVVKPQLKYNGVDFKYELPQGPVWLRANKIELEEVLVNLTTNSVQAILEMPKDHKREITLFAYRTGADQNTLRIDFSDTGSGIEAKLIEDIFLDFVTTKASSVSTGLGLSISRKIIERHKGKIWAESEGKNKGAAFHIELPIPTDITEEEIKQAEELRINKEKRLMI